MSQNSKKQAECVPALHTLLAPTLPGCNQAQINRPDPRFYGRVILDTFPAQVSVIGPGWKCFNALDAADHLRSSSVRNAAASVAICRVLGLLGVHGQTPRWRVPDAYCEWRFSTMK